MSVTLQHVTDPNFVVVQDDGTVVMVKAETETLIPLSPKAHAAVKQSTEWTDYAGTPQLAAALERLLAEPDDTPLVLSYRERLGVLVEPEVEMAETYREKLARLASGEISLGDRSKYPGGRYPGEEAAGDKDSEEAAEELGPSGKPLPAWRIARREMKEKARKAAGGDVKDMAKAERKENEEKQAKAEKKEVHKNYGVEDLDSTINEKKLAAAIDKSGTYVAEKGAGRREYAQILDGQGKVLLEAEGTEHRVKVSGPIVEKMRTPGSNITWVHNHPSEGSLSSTDFATSSLPGIKEIVATTLDGSVYRGKGFSKTIGPLWKGKMDAITAAVGRDWKEREVADKFFAHVVNTSLAEEGHVQYAFKMGERTTKAFKENQPIIEKMLTAARAGGRRVRERKPKGEVFWRFTRESTGEYALAEETDDTPDESDPLADKDVAWIIDPPSPFETDDAWWQFIDEMDELGVPEALWADFVPDDLGEREEPEEDEPEEEPEA